MISAETAQAMVLLYAEGDPLAQGYEKFALQSCELSTRGDYWIVRVNSEAYVLHGRADRCYVGVNAYLVNVVSGDIETVGSAQSVEWVLQENYDLGRAGGMHYTLQPTFDRTDKAAIFRFKQAFDCSLQSAIRLVAPENRNWLTGPHSALQSVQAHLKMKRIDTDIVLLAQPSGAAELGSAPRFWEDVKSEFKLKLCVLG